MSLVTVVAAVAVMGTLIGLALVRIVKRGAASPSQAKRRSRILLASVAVLLGIILTIKAVQNPGDRYFAAAVAAIAFATAIAALREIRISQ